MDLLRDQKHAEWEYAWRIMTGQHWITREWQALMDQVRMRYAMSLMLRPYLPPNAVVFVSSVL